MNDAKLQMDKEYEALKANSDAQLKTMELRHERDRDALRRTGTTEEAKMQRSLQPKHDAEMNQQQTHLKKEYARIKESLKKVKYNYHAFPVVGPRIWSNLLAGRLSHLHWLPVHRRIQYKIALLTCKSLSTNQPPYLRNLLHMYQPSRCLRSASQNLLSIPFCATNFGKRSFSYFAPTIWNELPAVIP